MSHVTAAVCVRTGSCHCSGNQLQLWLLRRGNPTDQHFGYGFEVRQVDAVGRMCVLAHSPTLHADRAVTWEEGQTSFDGNLCQACLHADRQRTGEQAR